MNRIPRLRDAFGPALGVKWLLATLIVVTALGGSATAARLLTGKDVKDGSLGGRDVKNGSLGGKDVHDSSIAGRDVKNRSLTPRDFRGSVRGPAGPQGPRGASVVTNLQPRDGPITPLPGFDNATGSPGTAVATASCGEGEIFVSGGSLLVSTNKTAYTALMDAADFDDNTDRFVWRIGVLNLDYTTGFVIPGFIQATVNCVPIKSAATRRRAAQLRRRASQEDAMKQFQRQVRGFRPAVRPRSGAPAP